MADLSDRQQEILRASAVSGGDGTSNPQHPRGAWGDLDEDYSQAEANKSAGVAANRDADGVGSNSIEEVQTYYDSVRQGTIKLTDK